MAGTFLALENGFHLLTINHQPEMLSPKFRGELSSTYNMSAKRLDTNCIEIITEPTSQAKTVLAPFEIIVETCRRTEKKIDHDEISTHGKVVD
jgi:hypothetical protein